MNEHTRYEILNLVDQCYELWSDLQLPTPYTVNEQRFQWIDQQSPYGLLVQNTAANPFFIYANKKAQTIFGYDFEEFLGIPSSKSAPHQEQDSRKMQLQEVTVKGISKNFQGIRVDKAGHLFQIKNSSIWKLINESGEIIGIAAMIWSDHSALK